jgi:glucokinase
MTLDEYNAEVKAIMKELQDIATMTATQALAGAAHAMNPDFVKLMNRQWTLIQRFAKLNSDMLLGVLKP